MQDAHVAATAHRHDRATPTVQLVPLFRDKLIFTSPQTVRKNFKNGRFPPSTPNDIQMHEGQ
jgi:hypothetical protein